MSHNYFLYARKSSEGEERQALSIEAQLAELKIFAAREKIAIKEIFIESMSAKQPGRPVFNLMLSRIEEGEADGILAWHPDRIARNSVDGGRIVYMLDNMQIQSLKFPTFWFENTPQGKFMLNISFGQSKYYVDNLSENVKRGIRHKLRRGEWPCVAPIGYKNNKTTRNIELDQVKAPLIKKIFQAYATSKHSFETLRQYATQIGLVSTSGRKLSKAKIQDVLRNPFYYGLMLWNGETFRGAYKPIITKQLFDHVQQAIAAKGRPDRYQKHSFPFLGLAKCRHCGCAITAERQKGHHYYRCTGKRGNCNEPYTREEILAEQISQAISSVAINKKEYQYVKQQLTKDEQASSQHIAQQMSQINTDIKTIDGKLDHLLDAHLERLVSKEEYHAKKKTLMNEKVALEEKKAKLNRGAMCWLEPCANFFQAAHQAYFLSKGTQLEAQKNFIQKNGSNHLLSGKRLRFRWGEPWWLIARKSAAGAPLRAADDQKKGPQFCKNRGHLQAPSGLMVKMSG